MMFCIDSIYVIFDTLMYVPSGLKGYQNTTSKSRQTADFKSIGSVIQRLQPVWILHRYNFL